MTSNTKNKRSPLEELFSAVFEQTPAVIEDKMKQMPNACPLDLLAGDEIDKLTRLLRQYGPLRAYIDEHYIALLIALSSYEDFDMHAKIKAHIINNIRDCEVI